MTKRRKQRRKKQREDDFLLSLKISDENGRKLFEIDEKLKDGVKKILELCNEKFSIDWRHL